MSSREWQNLFNQRLSGGKYLMFLADIVGSHTLTDEYSIESRHKMFDVMNAFIERISNEYPNSKPCYEQLVWEKDTWTEMLLTNGFLVQGDAFAIVLDAQYAPSESQLLDTFYSYSKMYNMPFEFHTGIAYCDSLNRLDADNNTLTVNHCFALLERTIKE